MVHVTLNGVTSLNLTISKPRESAECVQNYIITVTSTVLIDTLMSMVDVLDSTPAFDTITNLSMCKYNYTVNVVAVDLAGNWSQPFVSMPRITLEGKVIFLEKNDTVIHICETRFAKTTIFQSRYGNKMVKILFLDYVQSSHSIIYSNLQSNHLEVCRWW